MEQGFYEGRRGNKRLKAIEKNKEKVLSEFRTEYELCPEMQFLREEIRWEGTAELIFVMAMRNVNFAWNGLRDYGFLRLCKAWIEKEEIASMTSNTTADMLKVVLPEQMCRELSEELSVLEIF